MPDDCCERRSLAAVVEGVAALVVVASIVGCAAPAQNAPEGRSATRDRTVTKPSQPLGEASEEATPDQLALARDQGRAEAAALSYLFKNEAAWSTSARAGEYELAVALIPPDEGVAPDDTKVHLGVFVRDGYDGRSVPNLAVHAHVSDANGRTLLDAPLALVCDPLLNHYGRELGLGAAGPLTIRVHIDAPRFRRHDPLNGDRYHGTTDAEFRGVTLRLPLARVRADSVRRDELSRAQGVSIERALATMLTGVAVDGGETRVGDYLVAFAVEYAEGFWCPAHDGLEYDYGAEESSRHNAHVEVAVRDAATGRLFPDLDVAATLSLGGERVGSKRQALMWHPWLYHYGENWRVPKSAQTYRLDVSWSPSRCVPRFATQRAPTLRGASVSFDDVHIQVGQK
jgi:hypothetical protein